MTALRAIMARSIPEPRPLPYTVKGRELYIRKDNDNENTD